MIEEGAKMMQANRGPERDKATRPGTPFNVEMLAQICVAWELGFEAAAEFAVYERYQISSDSMEWLMVFRGKTAVVKNLDSGQHSMRKIFEAVHSLIDPEVRR
jgi:hypothetical protein